MFDWKNQSPLAKLGIATGFVLVTITIIALLFRMLFVNFVDSYELGYKYNTMTGETTVLKQTGYIVSPPFVVKIHTIDLRPVQVCINANSRVLNCKLVRFNPKGLDLFLSWHGRNDYSIEGGAGGSGNLAEILKSYAYDGSKDLEKAYPFIEIMKELNAEKTSDENNNTVLEKPIPSAIDTSKKGN